MASSDSDDDGEILINERVLANGTFADPKPQKRKAISDDSEEEEELSDGERQPKKRKKRKRTTGRDFILDDVEVASEDDDEENETYDDDENERLGPSERAEAERAMREAMASGRGKRPADIFPDLPEEEMEKYLEEKYGGLHRPVDVSTMDDGEIDEIGQQSLQPSPKDPNLWLLKCRMGEERHVATLLMRKFIAYQTSPNVSAPFLVRNY